MPCPALRRLHTLPLPPSCTGFAVFRSPLKPESEPALRMLRASGHQLVMITGDTPLTACHAARAVHIVTRPVLVLAAGGGENGASALEWVSPDERTREQYNSDPSEAVQLAQQYDLCLTGDALQRLHDAGASNTYIPLTQVDAFSRHSAGDCVDCHPWP